MELVSAMTNHINKEIRRAIKVMKNGKAADVVGVTAKAIKDSINRSAELLHKLFSNLGGRINTSRLERRITGDAVKERDLQECGNYREIILLSVSGKIFSRIMSFWRECEC